MDIGGLVVGKIITHGYFNDILHELHIGRTTNDNIWKDAIKPYTWVRVFMKDGSSYLGQFAKGESFQREPIILLSTYQKLDEDGDIVLDHSQDAKEFILVNTKDFDRVEITHSSREESLVDS